MDPQPDPTFPNIAWPKPPPGGTPGSPNPALLVWALHRHFDPDGSRLDPVSGLQPQPGDITSSGKSIYGIDPPPSSDDGLQVKNWNPQTDWRPIQPDASGLSDVRYRTAQPGTSISTLPGTGDPRAIGKFMRPNGLRTPPRASQGLSVDGTYYPPNRTAAAVRALAQPAAAASPKDFSVQGLIGPPRSPASGRSVGAPLPGPLWAGSAPGYNGFAQDVEKLQHPSSRSVFINGVEYQPFQTATADGLAKVPHLEDIGLDEDRGRVLDQMERNILADTWGVAWLQRPYDPQISAGLNAANLVGDTALAGASPEGEPTLMDEAAGPYGRIGEPALRDGEPPVPIAGPPSIVHSANGFIVMADDLGRTYLAYGSPTHNPEQTRNRAAQAMAGGADRLGSDDGGHFIGRQLNGPPAAFNHFAQDANFNRGAYRAMENRLRNELDRGSDVSLNVRAGYIGQSLRPARVDVRHTVNGVLTRRTFKNRPGG